jgi:AcrR family transcriptional regulator
MHIMGIKERKEREKNERRELILKAASEIAANEGLDNLSIRKIASKIEYSPAIIYHYFENKEAIMEVLLKRGYQKILQGLLTVQDLNLNPKQQFAAFIRNYIAMALQNPEEYKAFLLNDSSRVLEYTGILYQGASAKPGLSIICQGLKAIWNNQGADENILELTAQIIWSSMFGLIIRLIIEKNLPEEQRQKLIEHYIHLVVNGMIPTGLGISN